MIHQALPAMAVEYPPLDQALAQAGPGDTVWLTGTYYERLVTRAPGVTFESVCAVFDGSRLPEPAMSDQNRGVVEVLHDGTTIRGLEVRNAGNTGVVVNASHVTLDGNKIHDVQWHAISVHTGRQPGSRRGMIGNLTIEDNEVYHATLAGGHGQAVSVIADGFVVKGNRVHDNTREAIDVWLGARRGEVIGNEIWGTYGQRTDGRRPGGGIYVDGAMDIWIHHNRVRDTRFGIGISSESPRHRTERIRVEANVVERAFESGVFVWDDPANLGIQAGTLDVAVVNNLFAGNRANVRVAGEHTGLSIHDH